MRVLQTFPPMRGAQTIVENERATRSPADSGVRLDARVRSLVPVPCIVHGLPAQRVPSRAR